MSPQTQTHRLRLTRTKVQSNTLPKRGREMRSNKTFKAGYRRTRNKIRGE